MSAWWSKQRAIHTGGGIETLRRLPPSPPLWVTCKMVRQIGLNKPSPTSPGDPGGPAGHTLPEPSKTGTIGRRRGGAGGGGWRGGNIPVWDNLTIASSCRPSDAEIGLADNCQRALQIRAIRQEPSDRPTDRAWRLQDPTGDRRWQHGFTLIQEGGVERGRAGARGYV